MLPRRRSAAAESPLIPPRYPREGHSVLEPIHLRDNLNRILSWFDRYVKSSS